MPGDFGLPERQRTNPRPTGASRRRGFSGPLPRARTTADVLAGGGARRTKLRAPRAELRTTNQSKPDWSKPEDLTWPNPIGSSRPKRNGWFCKRDPCPLANVAGSHGQVAGVTAWPESGGWTSVLGPSRSGSPTGPGSTCPSGSSRRRAPPDRVPVAVQVAIVDAPIAFAAPRRGALPTGCRALRMSLSYA